MTQSRGRILVAAAALAFASSFAPGAGARSGPQQIEACPMLPSNNIWNTRVDGLPVGARSDAYVATIGAGVNVHPDFGSGLWQGGRIGIPYTTVQAGQPLVDLSFEWPDESDPGPYPIPTDAPIEGPPGSSGDRHILVVDRDTCRLYEVYRAVWQPDGSIEAGSGAVFDLNSNALRPNGWTSADAAGLPILPGLVRYDEVASGALNRAIRFTAPETQRAYVWPARHFASFLVEDRFPPLGQRFRLKADVPIDGFSPSARVIAQTLKTFGMILADNGSPWFLSGVPDERWDNDQLRELKQLRGSDFEAVDVSSLMVDPDSGVVAGAPTPSPTVEETPTASATETPAEPEPTQTETATGSPPVPTMPTADDPTPTATATETSPAPTADDPTPTETTATTTPAPTCDCSTASPTSSPAEGGTASPTSSPTAGGTASTPDAGLRLVLPALLQGAGARRLSTGVVTPHTRGEFAPS